MAKTEKKDPKVLVKNPKETAALIPDITEEPKEEEFTPEQIADIEEHVLLSFLAAQILATELFDVAKVTIDKSAIITAHNRKILSGDATKFQKNKASKDSKEFLNKVKFDLEQYSKYTKRAVGYVQRSERYETVLKNAINHLANEMRVGIDKGKAEANIKE